MTKTQTEKMTETQTEKTTKTQTEKMTLPRPLPPGRSFEQIKHHYEVEKVIARRLRESTREERKTIYKTMYDELFREVPDHPRVTRRTDPVRTARSNTSRLRIIRRFVSRDTMLAEFGPGDCSFSIEMASHVRHVYAVDISDQRAKAASNPANFELVLYDGYSLPLDTDSVDVAFSDKLIEHIHPDDTQDHFRLVRRVLRNGGIYVFRTPHRHCGPHDISVFFSEEPEGFHLKEWTYVELLRLVQEAGYSSCHGYWQFKGRPVRMPIPMLLATERMVKMLPRHLRMRVGGHALPHVLMVAIK